MFPRLLPSSLGKHRTLKRTTEYHSTTPLSPAGWTSFHLSGRASRHSAFLGEDDFRDEEGVVDQGARVRKGNCCSDVVIQT